MGNKIDNEAASHTPLSNSCTTYRLAVSTTTARIAVTLGTYLVALRVSDPFCTVYLRSGDSNVNATEPAAGASQAGASLRGDFREKFEVTDSTHTHVAAILSSGATANDLILTRLF
jgi:hypothetical protein